MNMNNIISYLIFLKHINNVCKKKEKIVSNKMWNILS